MARILVVEPVARAGIDVLAAAHETEVRLELAERHPPRQRLPLGQVGDAAAMLGRQLPHVHAEHGGAAASRATEAGEELHLESLMPENGVIFSDGVESDTVAFNSGAVVTIRTSSRRTRLAASG